MLLVAMCRLDVRCTAAMLLVGGACMTAEGTCTQQKEPWIHVQYMLE